MSRYRELFVHRDDVFAHQQSSGAYLPVLQPLTDLDIADHLAGHDSYGVYVIDPAESYINGVSRGANTVRYVVFDLDTYDADALDFLTRAVERLVFHDGAYLPGEITIGHPLRCLLLEDSGGKGYHIWLLLSEPVPAAKARAWAEPIRKQYNVASPGGETSWPALEIFPKQDAVEPSLCRDCTGTGQSWDPTVDGNVVDCVKCNGRGSVSGYGNLVKLPLGRHAKTGATSIFLHRAGWASGVDDVVPFPVEFIPEAAPVAPRADGQRSVQGDAEAPFACISKILSDGAGRGVRDNALYHFARYAVSCGLPAELVEEWCELVNEGFDPPMTATEVRTKVRSALHATNANPGCRSEWLRDFCDGGERCFAPWNGERVSRRGISGESSEASAAWLSPEERRRRRQEGE